jgi:tetratricopeptide (TPR) repeat protein
LFLVLAAAVAAFCADPRSLFEEARSREQAGDWPAAESAYRSFLKIQPGSAEALSNLGAVLARQEKFEEAIRAYRSALALRPALTPVRLNLALAYYKQGQRNGAIVELRRYLKSDPTSRQARQLLAISLLESDQYAESSGLFEALLPGGDFSIRIGLATSYARMGRQQEASRVFDEVLRDEQTPEVQFALGQAYLSLNDPRKAEDAFLEAAKQNAALPGLHFALGSAKWKQQDAESAVEHWREELAMNPNSFDALFALGAVFAEKGQPEAERYLHEARKRRPSQGPTLYYLGKLSWKQKRSDAEVLLERSLRLDPGNRQAHYLLSQIYLSQGRKADSTREMKIYRSLSAEATQKDMDILIGLP